MHGCVWNFKSLRLIQFKQIEKYNLITRGPTQRRHLGTVNRECLRLLMHALLFADVDCCHKVNTVSFSIFINTSIQILNCLQIYIKYL